MSTNSIRLGSVAVIVAVLTAVWLVAGSNEQVAQKKVEIVSGVSFGPIQLAAGKSLQVCACNLFGDSPAETRVFYFSTSASNQSDVIPPTGDAASLKPRESKCFDPISGPLQVMVLLVTSTANNWNSNQDWRATVGSAIVTDSTGAAFALPAVQHVNVPTPPLPTVSAR